MELNSEHWLEAHIEPGTSIYTLTRCMTLADLNNDGDYKLILADLGNGNENIKLKTFKGASLISETTLLDFPVGVCSFYNETRQPKQPVVAVASGPNLFVYRNFKPYYKFSIPSLSVSPIESDLWIQARNSQISPIALKEMLQSVQHELGISSLSAQSQKLLNFLDNDEANMKKVIDDYANEPVERIPLITCMSLIMKNSTSEDGVAVLICGCEHGDIYFIDPQAFTLIDTVSQSDHAAPVAIRSTGLYEVEYKIFVSNRNGQITVIQRGMKMSKILFQLVSPIVDFTVSPDGSQIFLISLNSLQCYNKKGRRQWEESLPNAGINILSLYLDHLGLNLVAVSLKGGNINLYNGRQLVEVIPTSDNVAGLIFGRFVQEDHCLLFITDGGTFQIKILKRTAKFSEVITVKEDFVIKAKKFQIPRRSKLILEEIAKEKANPFELHQRFQRELFELRLSANETLHETLKKSNIISENKDMPIKMSAQVFGLGPTFKIRITLDNMAESCSNLDQLLLQELFLLFYFNQRLYRLEKPYIPIPFLVPGLEYVFETRVYTLVEAMVAEDVMVLLIAPPQTKPLLSAAIHIPICDVLPIEI